MKRTKLSILSLAAVGAIVLTGCGNDPKPVRHTVTEEEYSAIRSLMISPRIF